MSRVLPVLGAAALLPLALAVPASAQEAGAEVRVLHGIPGVPVDVYVDGALALDDFAPGTTTDDLALPAGTYSVAVFGADAPDDSGTPVIGPADLTVPATGNVSVVAHLTEDGTPTLTPFVNDTTAAAAGQGRVVVRHTAAAPTVDVLVGGTPALTGITNPGEDSADLPAGTISAAVAATGTTEPVIGPVDVPVVAGQSTIVYAIGSLEDETLDVLVQTVALDAAAAAPAPAPAPGAPAAPAPAAPAPARVPAGVPAGTGGLLEESTMPTAVLVASGLGLAIAATGGAQLARARRQQ